MKKKITFLRKWGRRIKAKTPVFWAVVRNFFVAVIASVGVVNTTASTAIAPAWFTTYQWYIVAFAGLAITYAQSQAKTDTK